MARLFITPREVDFISDLTKEITKDVIGQKIYYYSISEAKTKIKVIFANSDGCTFKPAKLNHLWAPKAEVPLKFTYKSVKIVKIYIGKIYFRRLCKGN